jgi:hypothetical protein
VDRPSTTLSQYRCFIRFPFSQTNDTHSGLATTGKYHISSPLFFEKNIYIQRPRGQSGVGLSVLRILQLTGSPGEESLSLWSYLTPEHTYIQLNIQLIVRWHLRGEMRVGYVFLMAFIPTPSAVGSIVVQCSCPYSGVSLVGAMGKEEESSISCLEKSSMVIKQRHREVPAHAENIPFLHPFDPL